MPAWANGDCPFCLEAQSAAMKRSGILCVGMDDVYVKACLCDRVAGQWRLISWLDEQTPWADRSELRIDVGQGRLTPKIRWAADALSQFLGCDLWSALPLADADRADATRTDYALEQVLLTVNLLPPLRVWAWLPTPLHLPAVEDALHASESYLAGVSLFDPHASPWRLRQDLALSHPDLLLICGGYDADTGLVPDLAPVARLLGACLEQMDASLTVMYAGSDRFAQAFAETLPQSGRSDPLIAVRNVAPHPAYVQGEPLRSALRAHGQRRVQAALTEDETRMWWRGSVAPRTQGENFVRSLRVWQGQCRPAVPVHGLLRSGTGDLHALLPAQEEDPVALYRGTANGPLPLDWPPVHLISGWADPTAEGAAEAVREPHGFMPLIAPLFDVNPEAAWSILSRDLLQA